MTTAQKSKKKTIQERMAEEDLVRERIDDKGNRWTKVYFGGGEHFKNWLAQSKELGEVMVEEIDPTGYKCFEATGEKLYRIWLKIEASKKQILTDRRGLIMADEQAIKKEIEKLEAEKKDREDSLPAHSVRPQQILEIEELETAIAEKKKELEQLKMQS